MLILTPLARKQHMTAQTTLLDLFTNGLASHAAVVVPAEGLPLLTPYRVLAEQVGTLAATLRHTGLQPGDPVAIVLPNGLEYLAAFLAVTRARLVAAPLNPAYKAEEFRFSLEDAGARALIAPTDAVAARQAAKELNLPVWDIIRQPSGHCRLDGIPAVNGNILTDVPQPDDVALFLHTSGTTSRPKGVPLTHANLMASIRNIAGHYRLTPDDTTLLVMPLFHVHGLIGATLSTLFAGGTVIAPPRFSAGTFWATAKTHRATWYSAVPTIHQVLLSRADADGAPKQSGFRFIRSCSSALAPATMRQLEERFGAPVLEAYAMTEASHQMTSNPLPPGARKPGSVGRGVNVDVGIMDEAGNLLPAGTPGEVVVRGPNVTRGYRNNPEANATSFTNGWFRTGDRGVQDAEGYVTLIGRIKELINRGGEKISPLEIDAALLTHPAVAEAAAFGVPDAKYGEEVHAVVVLRVEVTEHDLRSHCAARLADFKVPKVLHIVKDLPKGPTGKVQRRHLVSVFGGGHV
jgi:acyl-CoA synthetase (AMP-forming)/AMP-acid ligase II